MSTEFDNILFDMPKTKSNTIKVIGVGGGGSNAVNHMFTSPISSSVTSLLPETINNKTFLAPVILYSNRSRIRCQYHYGNW